MESTTLATLGVAHSGYSSGVPGLDDAVTEALANWVGDMTDATVPVEDIFKKVCNALMKGGKKLFNDERVKDVGCVGSAEELIEDFVVACLTALNNQCWDQPWVQQADFSSAIMAVAMYNFRGAKVLSRTVKPRLKKYIEDAQLNFREEARISKEMYTAIQISGIAEKDQKTAVKHLTYSYDETFMAAPYGHTVASSSELAQVQDFLKYWLIEFCAKSWDLIEASVGTGLQEQYNLVSGIFTYVCDPEHTVLPTELLNQLDTHPPVGWAYVAELTMEVIREMNEHPAKRARRGPWYKWHEDK